VKRIIAALAMLALLSTGARATTWYISPTGNDTTGDGSSGFPWASMHKAAANTSCGDTVLVGAGTYEGTSAQFVDDDSCTGNTPIVWKASGVVTLKGTASSPSNRAMAWLRGSHFVFDGFTIDLDEHSVSRGYRAGLRSEPSWVYGGCDSNTVQNCNFVRCWNDGLQTAASTNFTTYLCYFNDCGYKAANPNLLVHSLYYSNGGSNNSVKNCTFYQSGALHYNGTDDADDIYTYQKGGLIAYNFIQYCTESAPFCLQQCDSLWVHDNLSYFPAGTNGMNIGGGRPSPFCRQSKHMIINNNTLFDSKSSTWIRIPADLNCTMGGQHSVFNNIFITTRSSPVDTAAMELHPLYYSNNVFIQYSATDADTRKSLDSLFVNWEGPDYDFHIKQDSRADGYGVREFVGHGGVTYNASWIDLDGLACDTVPDAGCYRSPRNKYWVNRVSGNDAYNGRSKTSRYPVDPLVGPFRTLAKAASVTTCGDTVYVAAGTFTGSEAVFSETSDCPSGNGNAIIWKAYGNVYLDGTDYATGSPPTLVSITGNYVTVKGFDIEGGNNARRLVYVNADNVTLNNLTLHNTSGVDAIQAYRSENLTVEDCTFSAASADSFAVNILEANAGTSGSHTIQRNTFSNSGTLTINGRRNEAGTWASRGNLIDRNKFSGAASPQVLIDACNTATITNNLFLPTGAIAIDAGSGGTHGRVSDSCYVMNNTMVADTSAFIRLVQTADGEDPGLGGGWIIFNNIVVSDSTNDIDTTYANPANPMRISNNVWTNADSTSWLSALFSVVGGSYLLDDNDTRALQMGVSSYLGVSAPTHDYQGYNRPLWKFFDIGANEKLSFTPVTPAIKKRFVTQ